MSHRHITISCLPGNGKWDPLTHPIWRKQLCQILEENMMVILWDAPDTPSGPCNASVLLCSMDPESKQMFLESAR